MESHQQNPDLPEAGGPLGHGRQLPAGAAHAAATAMATLGEQGANSLAWETHPEQTLKACVLSCFVQCSRWCWALPGLPPFGGRGYILTTPSAVVTSVLNVAIFHNFSQIPWVWWVWSEDYLIFCCHLGRSESISNWSVALIFTGWVSSSQGAKSLSHIEVMWRAFGWITISWPFILYFLSRYCPTKSDHSRSQFFFWVDYALSMPSPPLPPDAPQAPSWCHDPFLMIWLHLMSRQWHNGPSKFFGVL